MDRTPIARRAASLKKTLQKGYAIESSRENDAEAVITVTGSLGEDKPDFHATIVVPHVVMVDRRRRKVMPESDEDFADRFHDALAQTVEALRAAHP